MTFIAAAIVLSFCDISENEGLAAGSDAQQLSIKAFHSGSHHVGIWGRNVLFTMPPKKKVQDGSNVTAFIGGFRQIFLQNITPQILKHDQPFIILQHHNPVHTKPDQCSEDTNACFFLLFFGGRGEKCCQSCVILMKCQEVVPVHGLHHKTKKSVNRPVLHTETKRGQFDLCFSPP